MKVLLTNHFPFHGSGTGAYTFDLACGLIEAGHDVECLIVDAQRSGDELFPVERIVCKRGDATADLPFDFPCFTSHPRSNNTFDQLTNPELYRYRDVIRARLDAVIERFNPDIVHCQHIWLQAHLVLESGAPYVISSPGTDLMGHDDDPRYRHFAVQAAENAGLVLAASEFIRREVLRTFDLADDRVETLHYAIDVRPFQRDRISREQALDLLGLPSDCGPVVAFAGTLAPYKGIDVLLNAAAIYEIDPAGITTVIAGDGSQRAELEAQARRLGLGRTFFLGDQDREPCATLYQLANLVVMPTRGERFGLVALEALASGTPVVGTRAGGLAEILSEASGGLVPVDDHELLAEMILRAIIEDWKTTKGDAARAAAASESSAWIPRIEQIYRKVLGQRLGAGR